MGGRQHTRGGRHTRPGLPRAVLLTAYGGLVGGLVGVLIGVLAGVLLFCARPGEPHAPTAVQAHEPTHAVCVSPHDLPGCSPLAHVMPGLLPVPPPAVTVAGGEPPPVAATGGPGRIRAPLALARAPDLHVLQVLRT
ncbi:MULTISPECIES: hypothetical protein [unclassified Streptomyces]|uniref:hypothetical protein n=1 Tax=unclassified Streptomyces TaxID=2593676 RepID=UPI0022546ADA|nr:hypothetical protein [Streptomyces sp. NBC_00047]MCX5608239.1 hypothetical protein [Streptomyces sp. NBC_00047]